MRSPNYEPGQGARRLCATCNSPLSIKQVGRTRRFCSDTCRDEARRNANFRDFGATVPSRSAVTRNPEKTSANSTACEATLADARSPLTVVAPIVAIGRGISTASPVGVAKHPQRDLVRRAIRVELAARWSRGGLR